MAAVNIKFRKPDLVPCGFCGGKGALRRRRMKDRTLKWFVECLACGNKNAVGYTEASAAVKHWNVK